MLMTRKLITYGVKTRELKGLGYKYHGNGDTRFYTKTVKISEMTQFSIICYVAGKRISLTESGYTNTPYIIDAYLDPSGKFTIEYPDGRKALWCYITKTHLRMSVLPRPDDLEERPFLKPYGDDYECCFYHDHEMEKIISELEKLKYSITNF